MSALFRTYITRAHRYRKADIALVFSSELGHVNCGPAPPAQPYQESGNHHLLLVWPVSAGEGGPKPGSGAWRFKQRKAQQSGDYVQIGKRRSN